MSVPNQNITKTIKTKPSSDFLLISNHDWIEASKTLSPAGFQMYLWLIRHDTNFTNEVSRQAFINDFNSSESTYKRAWKDLKEKGYLQQSKDGSNIYYIYSNPNGIKNDPITNKVKNEPDNIGVKNDTNNKKSNGIKNEPETSSKMNPIRIKNEPITGSKMNQEIDNINNINIINKQSSPLQQKVKNDPDNIRVKNEPIIISQEDFIQQELSLTMIVHEEDNEGNKIVESCGKTYKIIPPKQTSTTQEQIAALGF